MSAAALRRLILPAVIVFLAGLAARMPASVLLGWVLPEDVRTRGIAGSIWSGSADAIEIGGIAVGPVSWRWRASALLSGRLGADVEAGLPGGFFNGRVGVGPGVVVLEDVRAMAALGPLTRSSSIGMAQGTARVSAALVRLEALWPARVDGELRLSGLRYAGSGNVPLGGYRLGFDGTLRDDPALPLSGTLASDDSAPFDVSGWLRLGPGRAYSLNAAVAPRADAPAELAGALRMLPTDAEGNRLLRFEGAL